MKDEKPTKTKWLEKLTSFLIVAFVVGAVIVVPGLFWAVRQFGDQLPAPIQKLAGVIGLNAESDPPADDNNGR